jgi:hypothetical protein
MKVRVLRRNPDKIGRLFGLIRLMSLRIYSELWTLMGQEVLNILVVDGVSDRRLHVEKYNLDIVPKEMTRCQRNAMGNLYVALVEKLS